MLAPHRARQCRQSQRVVGEGLQGHKILSAFNDLILIRIRSLVVSCVLDVVVIGCLEAGVLDQLIYNGIENRHTTGKTRPSVLISRQ